MKIFTGAQIHELDKYTIEKEPINSIDLMERAAHALVRAITEVWGNDVPVVVFAGPGNNGGDALAVARMLAERKYAVSVYLFNVGDRLSEDCKVNRQRLAGCRAVRNFVEVTNEFDPPKLDVPSGLMTEDNTYNVRANIIRADLTLTLQCRKLSFLFAENQRHIGLVKVLDIGLNREWMERSPSSFSVLEEKDVRDMLMTRDDFAHKGDMGNALIVAGCYGMAGAAILATKACLRCGVGKVTVCTPRRNNDILQVAVPEAVMFIDKDETCFTEAVDATDFDALGIGPGLGHNETSAIALITQVRNANIPMVIDADGLNMLANHRAWLQQLPQGVILTPHPKEFERIAGAHFTDSYERLSHARDLAERKGIYILLKGHYSALCQPNGNVVFNSTGNAGMATAGSGDVLTGMITALLARGYSQADACMMGMYLHGLAGDIAARELGMESLVASDIIEYLPKAFKRLEN